MNDRKTLITILLTLVGALVVAAVGALIVAYSGLVNVAATNPPPALMSWFLDTTREHSVAMRARDIQVPGLDEPRLVKIGADHYQEMCVGCHGAPGIEAGEAARGLEPSPPKLEEGPPVAGQVAADTFWIVKNGIQMTGMPAFGKTHDDAKLWAIVAFVRRLRSMSPQDYRKVTAAGANVESRNDSGAGEPHPHEVHAAHRVH